MLNCKTIIASGAVFALAACGSSGGSPTTTPNQANLSSNSLQFAVGTANLYGAATALNVVATYRQTSGVPGDSGALLDSPTLTLPAAIPAALKTATVAAYDACSTITAGAAAGEVGTPTVLSSTQVPGTTTITSFGQSGGVFGLGIEPFNATAQADCTPPGVNATGTPFQVAPYPVPLYDIASPTYTGTADPNSFVPWGGPPAFVLTGTNGISPVGNSNYPSGTAGLSEGIDVFAGIAPVAGGHYSLAVSIPANTGTTTQSKAFTLPAALTVLGAAAAPAFVPDAAGDGGGTFAFVMPAGAIEAYLQITDYGPATAMSVGCNTAGTGSGATVGNGTGSPVYYTIEAKASGTLTLPPTIGPTATPSICTAAQNTTANSGTAEPADQVVVQVVAFDYDLYGASYPNSSGVASPPQVVAHASDDLTISPAICQIGAAPCAAGTLPLLKHRSQAAGALRRL